MSVIPVMSTEKPTSMRPTSFFLFFLAPIIIMIPMRAMIGENASGLRSLSRKLVIPPFPVSLISLRQSIHAVKVVPIFEPKHTPIVCSRVMRPEFTNPTSITVIADEDCIAIVTPIPSRIALNLFEVIFFSAFSSLPPVSFSRPVDITFIP